MSKFTDNLRSVGVFNASGFYNRRGLVWIKYHPTDTGRGGRGAYFAVYGAGFDTDPDAHWRDYKRKTFSVSYRYGGSHHERKAQALEEAQEWTSAHYGVVDWAKDPFGGWGEAEYVKRRTAELKRLVSESLPRHTGAA